MLDQVDFEKFSFAFDRYLLSLRSRIRQLEEKDEDELLKLGFRFVEQTICHIRDGLNKSIQNGNWNNLITVLKDSGIYFQSYIEAEKFIISLAKKRLELE